MRRHCWRWMIALCLAGGGARAEAPPPEPGAGPAQVGAATRQWLDAQRQGKQASDKPQPLSGPVQEQVYERYRKSFGHPIPERLGSERVRGDGGTAGR